MVVAGDSLPPSRVLGPRGLAPSTQSDPPCVCVCGPQKMDGVGTKIISQIIIWDDDMMLLLAAAAASVTAAADGRDSRPNFLFLLADDWGWGDVGA